MTVQEVLNAAYAKSTKNQPGEIANEAVELTGLVGRILRTFFSIGAMYNPQFFGKQTDVTPSSGSWDRPADARTIFRLEEADGTEVKVVPFDDRAAAGEKPSVYRFGQQFWPAGRTQDPDPATDDLTFFYSKWPTQPTGVNDNIDPTWPEEHGELVVLEVAAYLAQKDGRGGELEVLTRDRDQELRLFLAALQQEVVGEVARHPGATVVNVPSFVSISDMLAGGSRVEAGG